MRTGWSCRPPYIQNLSEARLCLLLVVSVCALQESSGACLRYY